MGKLSESIDSFGMPLTEMASNNLADARHFIKNNNTINQLGIHMMKWLMYPVKSSLEREIKAFLVNIHKNILIRTVEKNKLIKTYGLHIKPSAIMKSLDGKSGYYFSTAYDEYENKDKLENLDLTNLDWMSQMGFSITEKEDENYGTHISLMFKNKEIANSTPN